jgi:hypothetical protein
MSFFSATTSCLFLKRRIDHSHLALLSQVWLTTLQGPHLLFPSFLYSISHHLAAQDIWPVFSVSKGFQHLIKDNCYFIRTVASHFIKSCGSNFIFTCGYYTCSVNLSSVSLEEEFHSTTQHQLKNGS